MMSSIMMSAWGRDWKKADAAFLAWLRTQPSCLSGEYSEFINGEGRCIAAHVRSANTSGTGLKPYMSAVPLTFEQHNYQHSIGERSTLEMFLGKSFTPQEAHRWFVEKSNYYVKVFGIVHFKA